MLQWYKAGESMKLLKTRMMKAYLIKLSVRIAIFLAVFIFYLYDKEMLLSFILQPIYAGINAMHILWFVFMVMMIKHLFPKEPFTMALLKREEKQYVAVDNYSKLEVLEFVQDQNKKAWTVMLVWIIGNGIVGLV